MSAAPSAHWFADAALLAGLGAVFVAHLRSAKYGLLAAMVIAALAIVRPSFWNAPMTAKAIGLAAAIYAVAFAAILFAERQDVRRIALLGGSLAGAELVNPLWGAAATAVLPLALHWRLGRSNQGGLAGIYVSILFIPALTAVAFLSLDADLRSEVLSLTSIHVALRPAMQASAATLLPNAPLLIAVALRPPDASTPVIPIAFVVLTAVCAIVGPIAIQFITPSDALGGLTIVLAASWPVARWRSSAVLLLSGASAATSWACAWLIPHV